jgi:hypothetical protein
MILNKNTKEYEIYLETIKNVFEKRAKKKFTREEVEGMAYALAKLGAVFHNYFSKQAKKEPLFEL